MRQIDALWRLLQHHAVNDMVHHVRVGKGVLTTSVTEAKQKVRIDCALCCRDVALRCLSLIM